MAILFFEEDIKFSLPTKNKFKNWLREIGESGGYRIGELNYIFCSDSYLLKVNIDYLNHDTFTDIITFDNSENAGILEGDIFISIDRIKENSVNEGTTFKEELLRVMSHGLLHLMGYKDKKPEDKIKMRAMEANSISLFQS